MQEIRSLTGLRGLAALLVMFYHYNAFRLLDGPMKTFMAHGYLMVDVFFVLSGYVMAMTYGALFQDEIDRRQHYAFLIRRIARIYPMYAITILPAAILIATGWMDHWPGPPIFVSALVNFSMVQSLVGVPTLNTPGWSISAEWMVYLVFPWIVALCLNGKAWRPTVLFLAALVFLPVMTDLDVLINEPKRAGILDIWNYETVFPVVRCFVEFTMGIIAFRMGAVPLVRQILGGNIAAGVLTLSLLVAMCIKPADILIVYLLPFFMISIAQGQNHVAKLLSIRPIYWLGQLSYAIYMIHDLMIYFIVASAKWLQGFGFSEHMAMSLFTLLFGLLVIALAQMAYTYLEQPARKYIRKKWDRPATASS